MSSKIFKQLTRQALEDFEAAFSSSKSLFWDEKKKKLTHSGEFGKYREETVRRLLELYIPKKFGIGSGFVITNSDEVSTQCDIIVYDKESITNLESNLDQRFFPIESVVAVGEIKSDIQNRSKLNEYLNKLARIKMLRETSVSPYVRQIHGHEYQPEKMPLDQIFTFIIGNQFCFEFNSESIEYDETIEPRFRHNMILSINDGLSAYETPGTRTIIGFPVADDVVHNFRFIPKNGDAISLHYNHFFALLSYIKFITILEIDSGVYLGDEITNIVS